MKKKFRRYVLHIDRKGNYIVFDQTEKRDIKGKMAKHEAIKLMKSLERR